jgi:hypothetical protein
MWANVLWRFPLDGVRRVYAGVFSRALYVDRYTDGSCADFTRWASSVERNRAAEKVEVERS